MIVANFFRLLRKNGQMKLVKKIIGKFSAIWNEENGVVEATVTSREGLAEEMEGRIKEFIKDKYGARETRIENIVDKGIQGGIILQVGDERTDMSVAASLAGLKRKLME